MKIFFKIFILITLLSVVTQVHAQITWGGTTDNQLFNFGFLFQGVSSEYKIQKTADWNQQHHLNFADGYGNAGQSEMNPLTSIRSISTWGGAIGFVASYNINQRLSLRLTPSYVFADRKMEYAFNLDEKPTGTNDPNYFYKYANFDEKGETPIAFKTIKSTAIEFPLDLKYRSDRVGDISAYLLAGAKYTIDLGAQKNLKDRVISGDRINNTIYTQPKFLSYAAGLGMTYYFNFFKLSAEVKYNQTFKNINVSDNNLWSRPIDKIYLRSLNFSLIFE